MSYKTNLFKNGLAAIDKIYNRSKYDENVDLFRSFDIINSLNDNQFASKEWLVDCIIPFLPDKEDLNKIVIMGSWYGLLGAILRQYVDKEVDIINVDTDPLSKEIGKVLCKEDIYSNNQFIVDDAVNYLLEKIKWCQVIINTSCEHMEREDVQLLVRMKKRSTLICLQSNNYDSITSHINTSNSLEEFIEYLGLVDIKYAGTKRIDSYDRYTVIGK